MPFTSKKNSFLPLVGLLACAWGGTAFLNLAVAATSPDDAQIEDILITVNRAEIAAGKLAQKEAVNSQVVAFAEEMIKDHSRLNEDVRDLARQLDLKPARSSESKSLKQDTGEQLSQLKKLQGADFDRAYIQNQVDGHQAVLKMMDDTLIPSATAPQLQNLLKKTRVVVATHLAHAEKVQAAL